MLEHLTPSELAVWNQLDRAVARLLKDPKRNASEFGNFDVSVAAGLRDKIGSVRISTEMRAQYIREALVALSRDEWWDTSISGGEC